MWNAGGSLSENAQLVKVADQAASGTGEVTGAALELDEYRSALFFCEVGTADPTNVLQAEISIDGGTTWRELTDVDGNPQAVATAGDHALIDCELPIVGAGSLEIRPKFSRGVATTLGPIYAQLYDPGGLPAKPAEGWERVVIYNGK